MLVAVVARLRAEDHLVDAALLVAPQVVADLVGGADRAAETEEAALLHDLRAEAVAVARRRLHRFGRVAAAQPGAARYSAHTSVEPGR